MPELNGAQLLVKTLRAAGVEVIFTLSGNQILPIYDACLDEGVRVIDTRHENAAVHMADAYARLTGRPGVCLVTAGPGHTNALTGLATAQLAESPLLLLSGGSELGRAGMGAFQEMDQVALAAPLCKAAWRVERPEDVPDAVVRAIGTMLGGRPGATHLTLPADVLSAPSQRVAAVSAGAFGPTARSADPALVARVAEWLTEAERPLVLGSPSLAWGEPGAAFEHFLGDTGVPGFVLESPRGLSDPALHGLGALFREADLVVLLAPQDFVAGFAQPRALAEHGRLIEVAPTVEELGRNRAADIGLSGDAAAVLDQLRQAVAGGIDGERIGTWRERLEVQREGQRARLGPSEISDERPIHPLRACAEVRARLGPGDVAVEDGGEFGQWARWALGGGEQRVVLNGKIGMIGCGLPFALGARVAAPEARVVAFLGDGTFGFHGFELDTAVRHNLPFVAVVGNDAGWAAERHRQDAVYGPDRRVASNLLETRYDEVARALGAEGELIEWPEQLGPALDRAFASGRPTVLNVRIASIPSPAAGAAG